MKSGDIVRCLNDSEAVELDCHATWEKIGIKRHANYLLILNSSGDLKLFGVRGSFKEIDFVPSTYDNYYSIPWFQKDYSQCGNWALVNGKNWRVKHSSNTYGGPEHHKIEGALFVDPHSKERIY